MLLKQLCLIVVILFSFITPSIASDYEWRFNLNLKAQTDPYGYRYGLMNRFIISESTVVSILNRVYEPADAYMIFRFAELSGHSAEYVLHVYYERRHYGWNDIAYALGIGVYRNDFIVLKQYHDMREVYYDYNYRRKERYEERYQPPHHHYTPEPKKHYAPLPKHPAPASKPQRYESPHHHQPAPTSYERSKPHQHFSHYHEPKQKGNYQSRAPQTYTEREDGHRKHH